jgi:hypothetical protein
MSFVIACRNPSTQRLTFITEAGTDDQVAEFETETAADRAARALKLCQAWGFQVVEIE